MKILAIETSCDETGIALIEAQRSSRSQGGFKNPCFKILKNLVASQIEIHRPFGGIMPGLAKREHAKNLPKLFGKIFGNPKFQIQNIDLIAVTAGPGLEPCLWQGINFANDLAKKWNKPLINVNHLKAHILANWLKPISPKIIFPAVCLIVSGGHTQLILMKGFGKYKVLGETRDDAAGEAFDKTGRVLGLAYPGGPEIEKIAKHGNPYSIKFPRPMLEQKNYDFSFSGLKTAVYRYVADNKNFCLKAKHNIAASFQQAVFDVLISKTLKAAKEFKAKSIILSGGVAANKTLRKQFSQRIKKEKLSSKFYVPSPKFCVDNAAMIAVAGYLKL